MGLEICIRQNVIKVTKSYYPLMSQKKQLGFTADDRRLNVALSRARQLLIIVGDDNMAYQGRTPNNNISNPFKPLIEYIDKNESCSRLTSSEFTTIKELNHD
jgi:superfamily I DNA and/or RNA helicase